MRSKISRIITILLIVITFIGLTGCIKGGADEVALRQKYETEKLINASNDIGKVKEAAVKEIKKGMTFEEIIKKLGKTRDVGSGLHVAVYALEDGAPIYFSYGDLKETNKLSGDQIIINARLNSLRIKETTVPIAQTFFSKCLFYRYQFKIPSTLFFNVKNIVSYIKKVVH